MNRFFIYKEYGAKYELMIKDVASAHRTMPGWETYQKGLEALASTLGPANSNDCSAKKSLTIGDLLVKVSIRTTRAEARGTKHIPQPIQRICKYPLLFAELLKYTPVADCPNSHMEVESALMRLREATAEINCATNDARMKATLEKTWLLQDRLAFPNRVCLSREFRWVMSNDYDCYSNLTRLPRIVSGPLVTSGCAVLSMSVGRPMEVSMANI
jgi:hypothetical protein